MADAPGSAPLKRREDRVASMRGRKRGIAPGSDHPHPIPGRGKCRVRIYESDDDGERWGDRTVVLCSQVPDNEGPSITEAAEAIYESVVRAFRLNEPFWIEHHGPESTDGTTETWKLVIFPAFGKPAWNPLDRTAVETLVGRRLRGPSESRRAGLPLDRAQGQPPEIDRRPGGPPSRRDGRAPP
jgi:hypothetical protein